MWYVYFLKSKLRNWYYVGSTNRLYERLSEHNKGKVFATKTYCPLDLVYVESFDIESDARKRERLLKDKRIAKEQIIRHLEGKE